MNNESTEVHNPQRDYCEILFRMSKQEKIKYYTYWYSNLTFRNACVSKIFVFVSHSIFLIVPILWINYIVCYSFINSCMGRTTQAKSWRHTYTYMYTCHHDLATNVLTCELHLQSTDQCFLYWLTCVFNRYDISSNSPSGGINEMVLSFSNLERRTHWLNFTSSSSTDLERVPARDTSHTYTRWRRC